MRYFPIFLDLKDRQVVVVGGGEEALRKVRLLLKTEARIGVVAQELHPELAALPRVTWLAKSYAAGHLANAALVYAADAALNGIVSQDAAARGIPVNVVDDPDNSTFIVPSIVDRDPLVVAIGTEGTAPMLGQGLRARIDAMLPLALGPLARAGADLRARVAESIPSGHPRRSFWTRFFFGDVRDAFVAGESVNYLAGVESLFTAADAPVVGRVTFMGAASSDAELLTIKAQRKLQEADIIVHDRTVSEAVLEVARRDAVRVPVDGRLFDGTDQILIREARAGKRVVRLSSHAPSLEETISVAAEGVAFEALPGIASGPESKEEPFPTHDALSDAILRAAS
jgi:uroporphyrin-III C-methyltransferase / precorrin-2 dehydrogenase / sirohydrochlorin ferrochelatase